MPLTVEHRLKISEGMKKAAISGKLFTPEHRKKLSESQKGRYISPEHRAKISRTLQGKSYITEEGRKTLSIKSTGRRHSLEVRQRISETHSGENHYKWIPDREAAKKNYRNDGEYKQWLQKIKKRDENLCRLKDSDCSGYNTVHHIKSWALHPELRYELNNGITLCQAHHPRGRAEEKRLEPILQALVSVSS